jgi:hypothetical protein
MRSISLRSLMPSRNENLWKADMETPVEIDFQGMDATPQLQTSIEEHVAKLEERCGRVTACRVVVSGSRNLQAAWP